MGNLAHLLTPFDHGSAFTSTSVQQMGTIAHRTGQNETHSDFATASSSTTLCGHCGMNNPD